MRSSCSFVTGDALQELTDCWTDILELGTILIQRDEPRGEIRASGKSGHMKEQDGVAWPQANQLRYFQDRFWGREGYFYQWHCNRDRRRRIEELERLDYKAFVPSPSRTAIL